MGSLGVGTKVQVRTGFDRAWASGFEVVEDGSEGYVVRRLSDGRTLPHHFATDDVRRDRKADDLWWV